MRMAVSSEWMTINGLEEAGNPRAPAGTRVRMNYQLGF